MMRRLLAVLGMLLVGLAAGFYWFIQGRDLPSRPETGGWTVLPHPGQGMMRTDSGRIPVPRLFTMPPDFYRPRPALEIRPPAYRTWPLNQFYRPVGGGGPPEAIPWPPRGPFCVRGAVAMSTEPGPWLFLKTGLPYDGDQQGAWVSVRWTPALAVFSDTPGQSGIHWVVACGRLHRLAEIGRVLDPVDWWGPLP